MESSSETTSFTENSPLLEETPIPVIIDRDTPATNPKASIFTCAVVCILFTELCERLSFYSITGNLVYFATESDHLDMSPAGASILSYVVTGKCYNHRDNYHHIIVNIVFIMCIAKICSFHCILLLAVSHDFTHCLENITVGRTPWP